MVLRSIAIRAAVIAAFASASIADARELASDLPAPLTQPADPIAYHDLQLRARALVAKSDWAAAEPLLAQLARDYPLDRWNWSQLGTARRSLDQCAGAIDAYAKSIALIGPIPSGARYWTAVCQARLGRKADALATLQQLIFEDRDINRPALFDDKEFASLKTDPRFLKIAGKPPRAKDRTAGLRGDLDYLLAEIRRLSPEYRYRPLPAQTLAAHAALRRDIPKLSDDQVYARLAQLIATLDANHTLFRSFPSPDGRPRAERFLPLKLYAFPEGFFVVDAEAGHRDLIGKRLVAIEGVSAEEAFRRVARALSTGGDAEAYWTGPQRMTETQLLAGLGIAKSRDTVAATFAGLDGAQVRRDLVSTEADSFSKLTPPAGIEAPLFLKRRDEAHWFDFWPDQSTAYVQFNQVMDDTDETVAEFGLRLRKELERQPVRNVILDLRHNNGGNTFTYVEPLRTLIAFSAKDGNQLYVLIGRNVYSAAANLSTELERLANPVFIGEPTGNTGNQEGDEGHVVLPYSGWPATIGAVRWQLSHPWDRRRSIAPHVPVQLTAKAYFAGQDPVLDTVKRLIARR